MAKPLARARPQPLWKEHLSDEILSLPRTWECFQHIEADDHLGFCLPPKNSLPGAVLRHVYKYVDDLIGKEWPLIYKLGFTHSPHARFWNATYGYVTESYKWHRLVVVYCGIDTTSAAYVEAALIQKYKGYLANHTSRNHLIFIYASFSQFTSVTRGNDQMSILKICVFFFFGELAAAKDVRAARTSETEGSPCSIAVPAVGRTWSTVSISV